MRPTHDDALVDAIADATRDGTRLLIAGGGSKASIGAPVETRVLDLGGFTGIVDYDPAELVLTVRAGTPLAEVEALVRSHEQMLPFAPFDHGPIFGEPAGRATVGGVVAGGVAGSERVSAGAPRDHLLGFHAVSGRGEAFKAGGKLIKNVTGFDLSKLAAGSWGRLFAMTEMTLKTLPAPQTRATRVIEGLEPSSAVAAMAAAMASQAQIATAAHIPARARRPSLTALRVEGFGPSVAARGVMLDRLLAPYGTVETMAAGEADTFWAALTTLDLLPRDAPLWRINVPPSGGPAVIATIEDGDWLFDWAGGLVWLATAADPLTIRGAAARAGGHAQLIRGDAAMRAAIPAFHPQPEGVAALEERIRRAFDPQGVFETGRF